jgi:hypothetical protein
MHNASEQEAEIWQQLEQGIWPQALNAIKPKQWDNADYQAREKMVWANLVYIFHHTRQLSQNRYTPAAASWSHQSSMYP